MQLQQQDVFKPFDGFNIACAIATCHATSLAVFLRTGFGPEGLGWRGLGALACIILVGGFTGDPLMAWYIPAYLIAVACQRLKTFWLMRSGWRPHSRYSGLPLLVRLLRCQEGFAK